jgi:hypothetical protein
MWGFLGAACIGDVLSSKSDALAGPLASPGDCRAYPEVTSGAEPLMAARRDT